VPGYRSLFAIGEFRTLLANRCVVMLSVAASALALGTITYGATRSPVLTGLSMFGGPLVSLLTSQLLLASSDSVRPRTALMAQMGGALAADALQLIPGLPWQWRFALLAIPYVVNSMFGGTQWVIVRAVVPGDSFILARSAMNLASGAMQAAGYAAGGLALIWLSPRGLFLLAAIADLVSLLSVRLGIADRPARGTGGGRNVVRRTAQVNRRLLGSPLTRPLDLALWVPAGLVVGCEALFVPYGRGDGPLAGALFGASAAGMMLGNLTAGRLTGPGARDRLIVPLRLLLAVPYLAAPLVPPPVTVALAFGASAGYAASLPLQERLLRLAGDDIRGQAMGLGGTGTMAGQAAGALAAGAAASWLGPGPAMAVMALASVTVTLALVPGLRRSAPGAASPLTGGPDRRA
jgi:hypothetical protein